MLRESISEFFGYLFIIIFALGWMDFGQGPDLTWWKLVHWMAS